MKTNSLCLFIILFLLASSCGKLRRCHDPTGRCSPSWCKNEVPMSMVWSRSNELDGQVVCLSGKVVESANFDLLRPIVEQLLKTKDLAKYKVYILEDDEGKAVLVHLDYSIPKTGARLYVNGRVNEFFRLGEWSGLVVQEIKRKVVPELN